MKLNYKRTVLVGFAFFLISAFWQAYDNTIPMILTNKFGMSQTWSGMIMAMDNVLALFLLPGITPMTRWAVLLFSFLPASYIAPGLGRTKQEHTVASGVCSLLTIATLVIFCIIAAFTA